MQGMEREWWPGPASCRNRKRCRRLPSVETLRKTLATVSGQGRAAVSADVSRALVRVRGTCGDLSSRLRFSLWDRK